MSQQGEAVEDGYAADTSDHAEAFLDYQAQQLQVEEFHVLVVCNLIFHEEKILLIRLTEAVKSWANRLGTPVYRLLRESDEHALEPMLNSRIDRKIDDEISVDEYARVVARTQVGIDPSRLRSSKAASALMTAVSPKGLEETNWLRASFLWSVEEIPDVRPDGYICKEAFWATEAEVDEMQSSDFFFGLKDEIKTAFDLRQRRGSMATAKAG